MKYKCNVQRILIGLFLALLLIGCQKAQPQTVNKLLFESPEDGGVWQIIGVTPVCNEIGMEIGQVVVFASSNAQPTPTPPPTNTSTATPSPTVTNTPMPTMTPTPVTQFTLSCPCAPKLDMVPNPDGCGVDVFFSCDCLTPTP